MSEYLKRIAARAVLGIVLVAPMCATAQDEKIATTAEKWDRYAFGNHRYAVDVAATAPAVQVTIPWRLRDRAIGEHKLIVTDSTGHAIGNVLRRHVDQVSATLVFEPAQGAGRYHVYFQPFEQTGSRNYPKLTYLPWQDSAESAWSARIGAASPAKLDAMPKAKVAGYEAVDPFDAYTDMERIASPAEIAKVSHAAKQAPFLLFGEDRDYPVRMFDQLPQRWAMRGPGKALHLVAARGEFLSFQLGLWTPNRA